MMSEQQFGWNYFENEVVIGDRQDKRRMIVVVFSNFMCIPYNRKAFDEIVGLLNEQQSTIQSLKEEKDSLVRVIDENLLKGYHEQSLKHKEAKEKMEHKDERMEASALIDAVFYWKGYVKALEELKERVSDE